MNNRKIVEFGDFQTPFVLAKKVCQKLKDIHVNPDVVLEPTCGLGAFIYAAANSFPKAKRIIGVEINPFYVNKLRNDLFLSNYKKIEIIQGDFFKINWETIIEPQQSLLVIGNLPWVTNAKQGLIGGSNLPVKKNFQNKNGFDAITGKSNFDISEWMLMQISNWLNKKGGYLAMLCKTSVARKILNYHYLQKISTTCSAIFNIDAKKHFGVSVDAGLLYCKFDKKFQNHDYGVYRNIGTDSKNKMGHRNGILIRDIEKFEKYKKLFGSSEITWRSGVKHDCSKIMELTKTKNGHLENGINELVDIESTFLYPLLKSSDIANNRIKKTNRYVLITQSSVGESTNKIKNIAPKTWEYLINHAQYLDNRKSRIYKNNPRFSIFGIGPYTFAPWKIAISGLYKNIKFRLVNLIEGKTVIFDDTIYFLYFDIRNDAEKAYKLLTSEPAIEFFSSIIFMDEKRPIKSSILNYLSLKSLEKNQYIYLDSTTKYNTDIF
ncbi:MAG TPA: SAM-dependent methyltransferase [Anaerolineae bacterium]|nr:SAM-dependent methyltransferase [Anaerolineae bacterium]